MWLPLACPPLGTWPATQACILTGNGTRDPLVHRPVLNPLSHTSQPGLISFLRPWENDERFYSLAHFLNFKPELVWRIIFYKLFDVLLKSLVTYIFRTLIYNLALYKKTPCLFLLFSPLVDSLLVLTLSRPAAPVGTFSLRLVPWSKQAPFSPWHPLRLGLSPGHPALLPVCLSVCLCLSLPLSLSHTHSYTQVRITAYNARQPFGGKVTIWSCEHELPLMKEEDFLINLRVLSLVAYWGLSKISYSEWVYERCS